MEYLLTAEEMQSCDTHTVESIGIPSLVLMERAALALYEEILSSVDTDEAPHSLKVLIMAGIGNNGADGLALARMLAEHGWRNGVSKSWCTEQRSKEVCFHVEVVICGDQQKATTQWKTQYEILKHFPVRTGRKPGSDEYDILVDALFGIGLKRKITGDYARLIHWFNERKGLKISADVPSGVHCDTGKILGLAVKADLTVCFAFGKRGLYFYPGCEYAGRVVIKNIGIGEAAFLQKLPGMFRYRSRVSALLPVRTPDGNKGTFGKVLLAAGGKNMAGAAVLAAAGCYRSGAGMVKVLTKECNRVILQSAVPEALLCTEKPKDYSWPDVLAIGPGLGTDEWAYEIFCSFLKDTDLPLIIDADGLNILAAHSELKDLVSRQGEDGRTLILTPHVVELSRLSGLTVSKIKEDPVTVSADMAQKLNCVIVSKDARSLICQKGRPVCLNTAGNSGMAVAGSGDVLTGVIAGLLAQGMEPFYAAGVGVYLHGTAGDKAAARWGERGMTTSDLVQAVAELTKEGEKYREENFG